MTTHYHKSNQYALAALKERRATIAGEIVSVERQLRYLRELLANVDGTLSLFTEDDPTKIPHKRTFKRTKLFKAGELNRLILTALRTAGKPLSTAEVVEDVARQLGHGPEAAKGLTNTIRSNLNYLVRDRGWVTKTGERVTARWSLAL
ncbi:hypothetical protein [Methylovirgula sp. HY1]|uniref:hypothetical protein n=1 Tax=Methylovirgula sp. HY1 TaxID=2822761 RepID=UPI001C5B079E|nr:hypothetical protein [Methylovirgula sp. HY1]QXX75359.1 hypothetical protein MHY1_02178 [Methylovirgula sp. HY1]